MANEYSISLKALDEASATIKRIKDALTEVRKAEEAANQASQNNARRGWDRFTRLNEGIKILGKNSATELEKITKQFTKLGGGIGEVVGALETAWKLGGIAAAIYGAVKLGDAFKQAADRSRDLQIQTDKLKTSSQDLQRLQFTFKHFGITPEQTFNALENVGVVLREARAGRNQQAASFFNNVPELKNIWRNPNTTEAQFAEAYRRSEKNRANFAPGGPYEDTPQARREREMLVFGSEDLLPVLKASNEEYQKAVEAAKDLTIETQKTTNEFTRLSKTLADFGNQITSLTNDIKNSFTPLVKIFNDFAESQNKDWGKLILDSAIVVSQALDNLPGQIEQVLLKGLVKVIDSVGVEIINRIEKDFSWENFGQKILDHLLTALTPNIDLIPSFENSSFVKKLIELRDRMLGTGDGKGGVGGTVVPIDPWGHKKEWTAPIPGGPVGGPGFSGNLSEGALNAISKSEGTMTENGINYNALPNGKGTADLINNTIANAIEVSRKVGDGVGGFQELHSTIESAAKALGLDVNKEKFSPENQRKIANYLASQPGFDKDPGATWHGLRNHPEYMEEFRKAREASASSSGDLAKSMENMQIVGQSFHNDCARIVNAATQLAGLPPITDAQGSPSLIATNAARWGQAVGANEAKRGDMFVAMNHKAIGATGGHVGIVEDVKREGGRTKVKVLSTNTQDEEGNVVGTGGYRWRDLDDQDSFVRRALPLPHDKEKDVGPQSETEKTQHNVDVSFNNAPQGMRVAFGGKGPATLRLRTNYAMSLPIG